MESKKNTSKIKIEKITYKNFGSCIRITNGKIEAIVTLDFGPRIISFSFAGGKNIFFEDIKRESVVDGEPLNAIYGEGEKWYGYGGHRMWLSPEDLPLTYYPDNEPVEYREIEGGIEFTAPAQRVNEVQFKLELIMDPEKTCMTVNHRVTNVGSTTIKRAVWPVTIVDKGGLEIIPQPLNDTGKLPNRVISLWPYSDMSDERVFFGKKYITLRQDPTITSAFKIGISNDRGWAAYLINNQMFVRSYNHNPGGVYPDKGVSYETFTNNTLLEMEALGELTDITPGSTANHTELFSVFDNVECPDQRDEVTIDALARLYIEK